ncbi:branched-chain amino acid transport system II carrier protein [Calidifontibacillus oryziterrae]|uniref:branched-chain amino acid transport system II carrier protein n=1 Tax=Calidifontibacillus oryziterrae TaxID=1191699 RepID=UPI000313B5ED|nr:branched-chain amino acid transport system II carrier protein [Calidifontibacillus oryziterrae]
MKTITAKKTLAVGLMLFALFFGAGNMIFPPALGQAAGTNIWPALIGFLITGVGLPLLGVTAIAISNGDLQQIANRVHPIFGMIFTTIVYLTIAPFFGIPRTGTVSFEIGIIPFLPVGFKHSGVALFIFTILFFATTFWLALNPSKLVDRIGKVLTPALLIILIILVGKAFIQPMGSISAPMDAYTTSPLFKGFIEGYLTMDAIAALVFGIVIITAIKDLGITDKKVITVTTIKAGIIAAIGLALVYISLALLGATSTSVIGVAENGGQILSGAAIYYYESLGTIILGLAITFACITTSVGLVSSCSEYFTKIWPKLSYRSYAAIFSFFSMIVANVGLTQLIKISVPVLVTVYPIAITLIILTFLDRYINSSKFVYRGAVIGAGLISIFDGLVAAGLVGKNITQLLSNAMPLYSEGVGWIIPAIIGAILGIFIEKTNNKAQQNKKAA